MAHRLAFQALSTPQTYDLGGKGFGYSDSIGADPRVYRTEGVDLKVTSDTATVGTGWRSWVEVLLENH
jgi:hypothetical protein